MKACIITLTDSEQSMASVDRLITSHVTVGNRFHCTEFAASTPATVDREMDLHGLVWTYPWEGTSEAAGMTLHRYVTRNRKARMACFMSHYRLWLMARKEPILILEDDALFTRRFDPTPLLESDFGIIGINDPRGATRLDDVFHACVQAKAQEIQPVPWIDDPHIPQGLAGASAYLMKPAGAKLAIDAAREYGAWPNDALLCKQLVPGLGVTRTYFTTIQNTPSTL